MKKSLLFGMLLAVFALAALAASPAYGATNGQGQGERVPVLIGFDKQPGPSEEALVRGAGGNIKHTYRLVDAIAASLPEGARTAFVLHDVYGYVHGEISRLAGCAVGTSKAQLHRARRLLRKRLES